MKSKKKPRNNKSSTSSSDEATAESKQKKNASLSLEVQDEEPAADSPKENRSKASDREARSRRRQAMIEEDAQTATTKRPRVAAPIGQAKKAKGGNDGRIKVPMLTGTLYIYRGARRRVEFIRKF